MKILDCTLRDGGYINEWNFGFNNIKFILNRLVEARAEIIECGFLRKKIEYNREKSLFDSIERFKEVMPKKKKDSKFVCMINYGDYNIEDIPDNDRENIDGLRLVFHKKDLKEAMEFGRKLSKKGYLLFIQPMVTINYSDKELIDLIEEVNQIKPYAFYIVDSFGVMKKNDLVRMGYLIDNNLDKNIALGYHSHNNLQLAYSNAQSFLEIASNRGKIIDSSIYGMGRGAGNLNTELFMEYLNEHKNKSYEIEPLLEVIDEVLEKIYLEKKWGYSLPYYLSAKWNCHPNYGLYLENLRTLTVKSMNEILSNICINKKDSYDKEYIHKLYLNHQNHNLDDSENLKKLVEKIKGREVLVLAPGRGLDKEGERVVKYIKEKNPFIISVNFSPENYDEDLVFASNEKRYRKLSMKEKLMITSNIEQSESNLLRFNYLSLLANNNKVKDNAALMLLNLLKRVKIRKVTLAGLDGYSYNNEENYIKKELSIFKSVKQINELNYAISEELYNISKDIELDFLTTSRYPVLISYQNH